MNKHREHMRVFRNEVHRDVSKYEYEAIPYSSLEGFPLNSKQCLYIAHWAKQGIEYERGLKELTGYTLSEFNTEDLVHYIHPEERELINRLTQEAVKYVVKTDLRKGHAHLFLSFRFRKKDGTYIKILRQSSSFELDNQGRMVSNFSLLTDISFIDSGNRVEWHFDAYGVNLDEFKRRIYAVYAKFFTRREKEVVNLISKGYTSAQIAEALFISMHTVATHRKKIFRKASVNSVPDLIFFCKKNGIL
ncbi:helix-turn-helix transcriptional regulator [Zobellia alginiliquefaciens]|uniref:helix-turn-helix transcriptional regulator n=1 Tax=Zobellia alginiliquefaciens TaxID=3032586 RepID=UPI0023E38361|nr:LuxR C-terminal-related transcriptional regulator [Zobellia alginiliquefaciens]